MKFMDFCRETLGSVSEELNFFRISGIENFYRNITSLVGIHSDTPKAIPGGAHKNNNRHISIFKSQKISKNIDWILSDDCHYHYFELCISKSL